MSSNEGSDDEIGVVVSCVSGSARQLGKRSGAGSETGTRACSVSILFS